jgi:hypothetical protein
MCSLTQGDVRLTALYRETEAGKRLMRSDEAIDILADVPVDAVDEIRS